MKIVVGLVVLGILIFVHEFGHFLTAKMLGVGVLEFSIGFWKKIWRRRIGGTYYSVGIVPLGGYVRMVGDDPSELPAEKTSKSASGEFLLQPAEGYDEQDRKLIEDRSKWFLEKGFLTKTAVVLAGPGFNLAFAWLLAIGTFWFYGAEKGVDQPVIGDTIPGFPAEKAGLQAADRVLSIDGVGLSTWEALAQIVRDSKGRELRMLVSRPGVENRKALEFELKIAGQPEDPEMALLNDPKAAPGYLIGIRPSTEDVPIGFVDAVWMGSYHTWSMSVMSLRSLGLMAVGAISAKNIGGPIAIMKQAAHFAQRGAEKLLLFIIFLSISLAIINLLPIPVLDGGHIAFFTIELIKGSPLSLGFRERAGQVGLLLLLGLMLFAVGNDIVNIAN